MGVQLKELCHEFLVNSPENVAWSTLDGRDSFSRTIECKKKMRVKTPPWLCNIQVNWKHIYPILIYKLSHYLTTINTPIINNHIADVILSSRTGRAHALSPFGKSPGSFPVGARSRECDNKLAKDWFCYLNLPVTLISGQKHWLHDQ